MREQVKKKDLVCAYPWALSVQLLPWLVQVPFSRPLIFASVLSHPGKTKEEIFIKPVSDFTGSQQCTGLQLYILCMQCNFCTHCMPMSQPAPNLR